MKPVPLSQGLAWSLVLFYNQDPGTRRLGWQIRDLSLSKVAKKETTPSLSLKFLASEIFNNSKTYIHYP